MILFKTVEQLKSYLESIKKNHATIGFVPTMGALHEGHLSLLKMSKERCHVTVCRIFVNPIQFNDSKDFEQYPITIEKDILLLEKVKCDILFLPSVKEIYPDGMNNLPHYNLGNIENILEGSFRPGHFQGVCAVVHRLLTIVQPQDLFMGQKDYQQCMVISQLLALSGLKESINLNICSTLREPSGLALSSRNIRLSDEDKNKATAIFQSLLFIKKNIAAYAVDVLQNMAEQQLTQAGFDPIDYVAIAHANTLEPITEWKQQTPLVALIAASLNGVRLIDNMPLN